MRTHRPRAASLSTRSCSCREAFRGLIRRSTDDIFAAAVRGGMRTLRQDGDRLAIDGITSLSEIRWVTGNWLSGGTYWRSHRAAMRRSGTRAAIGGKHRSQQPVTQTDRARRRSSRGQGASPVVVASNESGPVAAAEAQEKPGDVRSVQVELESLDRTAGFEIVASGLPERAFVLRTRFRSLNEHGQRAQLRHRSIHRGR